MKDFIANKTLIIGLGLLGGSIAKSFRKNNISKTIWAFDPDAESIKLAKEDLIIDDYFSLDNDLREFDLIAICAPLNQYQRIFSKINRQVSKDALIFDIGSIKNFKLKDIPQNFIPCHPIAGSELSGYENSTEDLFFQKKFIICDNKNTNSKKIFYIAQKIHAIPEYLAPKEHDKIYGLVSHLPQFLSFLSSEFSLKKPNNNFLEKAFRLDGSSPEIWQDIFSLNADNLEFFYENFFINLEKNIQNIDKFNLKDFLTNPQIVDFIDEAIVFNQDFCAILEKNFSIIFFRFLVVLSFLEIPEIDAYKIYGGNGFRDFISIINIVLAKDIQIDLLIKNNRREILGYFKKITE